MSTSYRAIILSCVLFASNAHAVEFFADALYWRALETLDWSLNNNLNSSNQVVAYQTLSFDYKPGFRIGVAKHLDWDTKIYYTRYYTKTTSSASGNLVSTFLGGKVFQSSNNIFFNTGQATASINFNMIDWDIGKTFHPTKKIMLRPLTGLRGGWIYQSVTTNFQGSRSITESVKNNFSGLGPKLAVESVWQIYTNKDQEFGIFADFTTSYMWGNWDISDVVTDNTNSSIHTNVGSRNFGAFTLQAFVGVDYFYHSFKLKFGYEISDWFNQYQILDDSTGTHYNDLVLQGLTLRLMYCF